MEHRITQCPRCGTSFRVTETQLAVAAGAVRCGSCLHIFNAREHWAEPETVAASPATPNAALRATPSPMTPAPIPPLRLEPQPEPEPKPKAEPEHEFNFEIDDDLLIDDNTPLFGDGQEEDQEEENEEPSAGVVFNPADTDFASADDRDDALIDDGGDLLADSLLDTSDWQPEARSLFRELDEIEPGLDDPADESWAEQLLEDEDQAEQPEAPARSSIFDNYDDSLPTTPLSAKPDADEELFLDIPAAHGPGPRQLRQPAPPHPAAADHEPEPAAQAPAFEPESMRADDRIGGARPLLGGLEPEPLQLHTFTHEPRWPKVLWGGAVLAGLLLLAGQYFYFNFDRLARGELRPRLVELCSALNCRVPPQYDLARIRTSSLIVRSHPTQRGALAVDAILTNLAPFGQPYPLLQLQFTDLDGRPVAGRQFSPSEYLGGELSGAELMPVQQPVHIALEVVDPGPRAVNYLLTVAPAADGG